MFGPWVVIRTLPSVVTLTTNESGNMSESSKTQETALRQVAESIINDGGREVLFRIPDEVATSMFEYMDTFNWMKFDCVDEGVLFVFTEFDFGSLQSLVGYFWIFEGFTY